MRVRSSPNTESRAQKPGFSACGANALAEGRLKWRRFEGKWRLKPVATLLVTGKKREQSFIEWASAQVPPTPLYLGGTVGRERERETERERERERWMDGWMDG